MKHFKAFSERIFQLAAIGGRGSDAGEQVDLLLNELTTIFGKVNYHIYQKSREIEFISERDDRLEQNQTKSPIWEPAEKNDESNLDDLFNFEIDNPFDFIAGEEESKRQKKMEETYNPFANTTDDTDERGLDMGYGKSGKDQASQRIPRQF